MSQTKLAIFYYSSTGTNHQLAYTASEAAKELGAEVRVRKVQELAPAEAIAQNPAWQEHVEKTKDEPIATLDDMEWADAFIFSIPTRFGNVPAQMKQFMDMAGGLWMQGKLANKVASAMTSASTLHGGQEETILSLYTTMYHWGTIVVAPGYTDQSIFEAGGNPYGTSVAANDDGTIDEKALEAVKHQARRVVTVTDWIKKGQA